MPPDPPTTLAAMQLVGQTNVRPQNFLAHMPMLFMGYLEEKFIGLYDLKPWFWWRFLDDVFMIWLHSEELKIFLDRLNTFHNSIKFTWEIVFRRICFLDDAVTMIEGGFDTDVYNKPIDVHQYYGSCHPPHVERRIPYGQ